MNTRTALNVLVWHTHGSWMSAFVQGGHRYLVPTTLERDDRGRGRAGRTWPAAVHEIKPADLRESDLDIVVLQRPEELALTQHWTGRRPGIDVPAVYVEHNAPRDHAATTRHPLADRHDIPVIHVTDFNRLMWDCGDAQTRTIEHGIVDPGHLYTGTEPRAATMINEPDRRWRITGTDLLPRLSRRVPIDVYGIGSGGLEERHSGFDNVHGCGDLRQDDLHRAVARHRVYVHTARWTSLGLSLLEAMHLGMPVVAIASTDAPSAVPADVGVFGTDPDRLAEAVEGFVNDPAAARRIGDRAREWALERYGLSRFLRDWDAVMSHGCGRLVGTCADQRELAYR